LGRVHTIHDISSQQRFHFNFCHLFPVDHIVRYWHFLAPEIAGFASLVNIGLWERNNLENSAEKRECFDNRGSFMVLEVIWTREWQDLKSFLELKEISRKKASWEPFMGEGEKGKTGGFPEAPL
jgi:hypothetical protein